jgi:hypothetical protein
VANSFVRGVAVFCAALGVCSIGVSDEAVPDTAPESLAALDQLPEFTPSSGDFYPESAARRLLQGAVGVELQIDAQGQAQILQQTYTNHPDFADKAEAFLKSGRFQTSDEWVQSGGPEVTFLVEVQFSVARNGDACEQKPPRVADVEVLVVCRKLVSRRDRSLR